jgi:hypothetical protein
VKVPPVHIIPGLAADAFGECAMIDLATRSGCIVIVAPGSTRFDGRAFWPVASGRLDIGQDEQANTSQVLSSPKW